MIRRLTLRNFKSIDEQTYDFTQFDLLVGRNNSGKSTILQALAIWQFCVDTFQRSRRSGKTGIQIILPNFTALPLPEFNLLWKAKTDRRYPVRDGKRAQEFVLISILVEWRDGAGVEQRLGVDLRYDSPQTLYAIPVDGWSHFKEIEASLPRVAYVPPFSGLEPEERSLDDGPIRQQVGKAQPGSVLRNLLLRVCPDVRGNDGKLPRGHKPPEAWTELADVVERWFGVRLIEPKYDAQRDVHIKVEYHQPGGKDYDVIAGGSGFHQVLTLLAFLYGYQPTTILLDEPDAHLHVNLQREILDFFKRKAQERGIQFLIATHAEEFARGVDAGQIVSLLSREPIRVQSTTDIVRALADVSNEEIVRLQASPYILYVEGESDERILRAWCGRAGYEAVLERLVFKAMGGGNKKDMKEDADRHFSALGQIIPGVSRLMLFDYDSSDDAFHPKPDNATLVEWKRRNIENYLLVPDAWKRAALAALGLGAAEPADDPADDADDPAADLVLQTIDQFFAGENLSLPPGASWRDVSANIFQMVDGKRILFEGDDSLFHRLRSRSPSVILPREQVALAMVDDELHEDVRRLLERLRGGVGEPTRGGGEVASR